MAVQFELALGYPDQVRKKRCYSYVHNTELISHSKEIELQYWDIIILLHGQCGLITLISNAIRPEGVLYGEFLLFIM